MEYFGIITYTNCGGKTKVMANGAGHDSRGYKTEAMAVANTRRVCRGFLAGAQVAACLFENFAEAREYATLIQPK